MKPLYMEREDLRTKLQMGNLKLDEKDEMLKQIGEITKTLEKKWYSNEFIYRELYISELSKLRGSERLPDEPFTDYLSLATLQIS
jgi:hypothetical protein